MVQKGSYRVAVLGAGAWGSALGLTAARAGNDVTLLTIDKASAQRINEKQVNEDFLPEVPFDNPIKATHNFAEVKDFDVIVLSLPVQITREVLTQYAKEVNPDATFVLTSKGLEKHTLATMGQVIEEVLPRQVYCALSGPNFAIEVAQNKISVTNIATKDPELYKKIATVFTHDNFRTVYSDDVLGVQIGGALKNIIAIAGGIVYQRALGHNTLCALITMGMAEISELGVAMGAKLETFMGLAGYGDLILTCSSPLSRNFRYGQELGEVPSRALRSKAAPNNNDANNDPTVSAPPLREGFFTAQAITTLLDQYQIKAPFCRVIAQMVIGEISVDDGLKLMFQS